MKKTNLFPILLLLVFLSACGENKEEAPPADNKASQEVKSAISPSEIPNIYASVDVSPMDMSYFPEDYPKLKMANSTIAPPVMRVVYSRPHLQKRHLFHDLLKYEEPWRLGANEATEIDFYKPVIIQGKKVMPGRYIIYCIPHADKWTIVLNSNIDTWGLRQDPSKDIQRFDIPISTDQPSLEYFTMVFEKADKGANLIIAWDKIVARLPIEF